MGARCPEPLPSLPHRNRRLPDSSHSAATVPGKATAVAPLLLEAVIVPTEPFSELQPRCPLLAQRPLSHPWLRHSSPFCRGLVKVRMLAFLEGWERRRCWPGATHLVVATGMPKSELSGSH